VPAVTNVFGNSYADIYDVLYRDKDYEGEVDLLERIFAEHGTKVSSILDLGCGTGSHALPLARRGYAVTGVDRSQNMLAQAIDKTSSTETSAHIPPVFLQRDVCSLDLGKDFNAAIMMFAVLGYQRSNTDLISALGSVRRHLKTGGLFIFDVWNGSAVLSDRPGHPVREFRDGHTRITRTTNTSVDAVRHCCHVRFQVIEHEGDKITAEHEEEHIMRFFFPLELDYVLSSCGLQLLDLRRFPDYKAPPDEHAWNIIGVAKAV
jgi:SAM-dependent methyltransferase